MELTERKCVQFGLTGFLDPVGVFYPCKYLQHRDFSNVMFAIALKKYPERKRSHNDYSYECFLNRIGYTSMGSNGCENMSHVRFPSKETDSKDGFFPVSEKQLQWFEDNFGNFDIGQQDFIAKYIHLYVNEDRDDVNGYEYSDKVEERFDKIYNQHVPRGTKNNQ
jgi:hypothetical protein